MFIKKIIISGFRSYNETNTLSSLSSGHNVIIGSNGSGKSNILNAIQFVLSDEFNGLNANQRQQLINESQSQRLLMAYVEVVLDNTDRRIPLELPEITFRRQIGLKKDQYFINNKIITHSDIVNMLETAGFSRSNPYYIVKQGKVSEMATASDEHRLQVMREVAGTRIYDQRKTEAMKLLAESQQRSQQIDGCLQSLDEKLIQLQNESQELQKFLKWDKRRRLLEYIIANKESEETKNEIIRLEDKLLEENETLDKKRDKMQEIQQKSRVCDKKIKTISGVTKECRKDLNEINKTIDEYNEKKAKIESKINDFKEKLDFTLENESKAKKELKIVKQKIESQKKRLIFVNAKYEDLKKKENGLICDLNSKQSRKLELYSKQKRKERFRSVDERNRWIRSELTKLEKEIETYAKRIADLKSEEFEIMKQRIQLENEQNEFVNAEETLIKSLLNEKKELCELNKQIKEMESKRSEFWDSENELKDQELKLNDAKTKMESSLTRFWGTSAIVGRQSVHKVLNIFEQRAGNSEAEEARLRPVIDGYLGQVIDCFSFDPNLYKAIDVTAKSKLFNHIVENDKIGTKIIKEMNERRMSGEITFIAINKLNVKPVRYPDLGSDARPLTGLIRFDKKYEKVMKFLFDRTLVCRNLELAIKFSRSSKLDCVTIDGDFVSHKGFMSGGYFSFQTRIETFLNWKQIISKIETTREKVIDWSKQRERNEQQLMIKSSLLSDLDIKHSKTKHKVDNLKISKDQIRQQLVNLNIKYESITRSISSLESTLPSMRANRDSFESELELSLDSQLNESEQNELKSILEDIDKFSTQISELSKRRNKLGSEKSSIESDLEKNLEQRKNELEFTLIDFKIFENETILENESIDCQLIDKKIESLRKQLEERNEKIDDLMKQLNEQKELQENLRLAEDKQMEIINSEAKNSRKIAIKMANIEKKNEECLKKLRSLGTIPSDCNTNYRNMSLSNQYRELQKCSRKLSKLTNVNQKALDQLTSGEEKKRILTAEKHDIDLGYKSIETLIESLEHQKYESIQLTYKQVSTHFVNIFKKLVPEGKANMEMIYSTTNSSTPSFASSQSSQSQETISSGGISSSGQVLGQRLAFDARVDNFSGVKIFVAFTGKSNVREMIQLSGGQKSIVALAFIFAIQKCDPAPFYLFDEVDHALDPIYRKALADLIKEMSKNSQFITTTFRPELLECGHKFFGVKFRNRVSHIQEVTAEEAKEFIESEVTADTSSAATASRRRRRRTNTTI